MANLIRSTMSSSLVDDVFMGHSSDLVSTLNVDVKIRLVDYQSRCSRIEPAGGLNVCALQR